MAKEKQQYAVNTEATPLNYCTRTDTLTWCDNLPIKFLMNSLAHQTHNYLMGIVLITRVQAKGCLTIRGKKCHGIACSSEDI